MIDNRRIHGGNQMSQQIPVWTANRGTMMMVKVALGQSGRTPIFVNSPAELERTMAESGSRLAIVGLVEIQAAGLTVQALTGRFARETGWVVLVVGLPPPDGFGPGVKTLKVPFSAAELRQLIDSDPAPAGSVRPSAPGTQDLTAIVRAEIERIVREKADAMVADAVMKMVPELAEAMIRSELDRLLTDAAEKAVSTDPAPDDET